MRELWIRARAGDKVARASLIERHMPLARSLAVQYRHAREPFDDLCQVANLGLVVAVDRLDQAEVRDLAEVVERLTGMAILDRQRARQRHVAFDQTRACHLVAGSGPYPQLPHGSIDPTEVKCASDRPASAIRR